MIARLIPELKLEKSLYVVQMYEYIKKSWLCRHLWKKSTLYSHEEESWTIWKPLVCEFTFVYSYFGELVYQRFQIVKHISSCKLYRTISSKMSSHRWHYFIKLTLLSNTNWTSSLDDDRLVEESSLISAKHQPKQCGHLQWET